MTPAERERFLSEVTDSEKCFLYCEKHGYAPGSRTGIFPMVDGCKECTVALFVHLFAKTPPHLRDEALDRFEELVRHACENVDKGQFELDIWAEPKVEFLKQ